MRKNMIIWILIILILLSGCNIKNDTIIEESKPYDTESPIEYKKLNVKYTYRANPSNTTTPEFNALSTEDKFYYSVVKSSTSAVIGEFLSVTEEDGLYVFKFTNIEKLYGNASEKIIEYVEKIEDNNMDGNSSDTFGKNRFKIGERYLLFLWKRDSVALEYSRYGICEQTFIPLDNIYNSRWGRGKITFEENVTAEEVVTYYKGLALEKGYDKEDYQPTVFRDKDLKYIVKNSDVILKVKVQSSVANGVYVPTTTYAVEIIDIIKGEEYIKEKEENRYTVNTHRNALEKEKTYILTLSRITPDDKDSYFCLSAQNGIIPIEDSETVSQVYDWLGLKEPVTE